jgi:hypothetical protein
MDTLTNNTKQRKSKRGERSLRIGSALNGLRALSLRKDGATVNYYLREIPVDFGRGFQLDKFYSEASEDGQEVYHVHLDKELGDSCTCKGFVYRSKCKHIDAIKTLVALGKV